MVVRYLTGITCSGTPHIGNYAGAIQPAIRASREKDVQGFYFLADLHALISAGRALDLQRSSLEIAATWLALGLDPQSVVFYRQSDVPEITELSWILACSTPKGLLNRAHAYKASVDANIATSRDRDRSVNAGLFFYPVLMSADILLFQANYVPVGKDQLQHIEIARDIALRFNSVNGDILTVPNGVVDEKVSVLPGLDGRKMSKSYGNTIPIFADDNTLLDAVRKIKTNSIAPNVPKNPSDSIIFSIFSAIATEKETETLRELYLAGIGWGEAKDRLFELLRGRFSGHREAYDAYVANPDKIQKILSLGAQKARDLAAPHLEEIRAALGIETPHRHNRLGQHVVKRVNNGDR